MKKLLPLLFLGISLASCSKKGDDPAPAPIVMPTIIGSWTVTDVKVVSIDAGVSTTTTEALGPNDYNFTFTADNKLIETFGKNLAPPNGYIQTSVYTYINKVVVAAMTNPLTNISTTTTYKVESLTNKALVLSYKRSSASSSVMDDYTLTLTR